MYFPYCFTEEIAHQLSDCDAKMVVSFGPLIPQVQQAMAINKKKLPIVSIGPHVDNIPRVEDILEDNNLGFAEPAEVSNYINKLIIEATYINCRDNI